jgi:hypothetical protein
MTALAPFTSVPSLSNVQHDYILLDGSGSMTNKWYDMLAAIDAYVAGLKVAGVRSHITLHVFDSNDHEYVARSQSIDDWTPLSASPIGLHGGTTPLYDAIAIMGRHLRDWSPPRAAATIVTDGGENASRATDQPLAKAILDWMRARGWQVTFVGAEFNNARQAELLGGQPQSAIGVSTARLTDATSALAAKRARYALYGEPMHWTDGERQQFGGFLAAPEAK